MNEINKTNLSEQTKYRRSEIIEIKYYFHQERLIKGNHAVKN